MKNAPKWMTLINDVVATIGTGAFNPVQDKITHGVMVKAVAGLMGKNGIDGALLNAVVTNIRTRRGPRDFTAAGPVTVTRHQKAYARKMGLDRIAPLPDLLAVGPAVSGEQDAETMLIDADLHAAFQQFVSILSASFQHAFSTVSAEMDRRAAEKLEFWVLNEMKCNERNHELNMTRPGDEMRLASSPFKEGPGAQGMEAITSPELDEQGAYRDVGGSLRQGSAHREDEGQAVDEGAGPTTRAVVSFFHNDPSRPPSANLEIGGTKYALVFSEPDIAEEHLREICSPTWIAWLEANGGAQVRMEARAAGTRRTRFRMAPLYDERDTFARKPPVAADTVVVIMWDEDEMPAEAVLVSGQDMHRIPLQKFHGRSAKAPTHKGAAVLPL